MDRITYNMRTNKQHTCDVDSCHMVWKFIQQSSRCSRQSST